MIMSLQMFERIKSIVKDECLNVESSSNPALALFETGKAAGIAQLADEIWKDWFGEDV